MILRSKSDKQNLTFQGVAENQLYDFKLVKYFLNYKRKTSIKDKIHEREENILQNDAESKS